MNWDIRRQGRTWAGTEALERFELAPEKFEMNRGRLFWNDEQRVLLLGLLLENVGVDVAVRLGNPDVWREAIAELP
jgi:hypothetical protein